MVKVPKSFPDTLVAPQEPTFGPLTGPGTADSTTVPAGELEAISAEDLPAAPAPEIPEVPNCYMISFRAGAPLTAVPAAHCWKMVSDEDAMTATANLFLELAKGQQCDLGQVEKYLGQGADMMAVDGEGCPALMMAVRAEAPHAVISALLEGGACPDSTGREGITPLALIQRRLDAGAGNAEELRLCLEALQRHGASPQDRNLEEQIGALRETFGHKIVSSLLTLQSPVSLPVEVIEVLTLLFQHLPVEAVKETLEPVTFRALTALLQHLVGGTESWSMALSGCRLLQALYACRDPALKYLVCSHGVLRWAQRLVNAKDAAQCGLYRQQHQEKVSFDELVSEAQNLLTELRRPRDDGDVPVEGEEWKANAHLVEVVQALERSTASSDTDATTAEGLLAFRELLKKAEKGQLNDERCAAFELEQAGAPALLLKFLKGSTVPEESRLQGLSRQPTLNQQRWAVFQEVFSEQSKQSRKGLGRLTKSLHAVIETGEAFPVWRHKKERGLRSLTEPLPLKVRCLPCVSGESQTRILPFQPQALRSQISLAVEPLTSVVELTRFLCKLTPVVNHQYLVFCHSLVGNSLLLKRSPGVKEECVVLSFETLCSDLPLPVHTLQPQGGGEVQRVILGVRDFELTELSPHPEESLLTLHASLSVLHAAAGTEAYQALLRSLCSLVSGEQPAEADDLRTPATQFAFDQVLAAANAAGLDESLAVLFTESARISLGPGGGFDVSESGGEPVVDPTMRVHTVMIAVSDEIPFELFWPMVRDDIVGAIRELCPSSAACSEDSIQTGVSTNGMGPIAQKLTLEEAETLAARVGHVVQTAVTVDQEAAKEATQEREKAASAQSIAVGGRVQFSPKSGSTWATGVVVGSFNDRFDLVDDQGLLWEKMPRSRVRLPPSRKESSPVTAPIQAVLSQADLVRIREHLRRRQEEWAERHAAQGPGGAAGGSRGSAGPSAGPGEGTSGSRPASAPVLHRPRAASAGLLDRASRAISREVSLSEADPAGGLEMVHFMDEEDYDEDGEGDDVGEDGEDDDTDLPPLEPSEAGDDVLGRSLRDRDGEGRGDGDVGAAMEDEMRVLEQLRAMEQIISEVLDPQDRRGQRSGAGAELGLAEDLFSSPVANLRIRLGGAEARVEAVQIRRATGSRGSDRSAPTTSRGSGQGQGEPLRGELPAFMRAADAPNPTSSLDHPVVERLGAADLAPRPEGTPLTSSDSRGSALRGPRLKAALCLLPKGEKAGSAETAAQTGAVQDEELAPLRLPGGWNILKVMQFLNDQELLRSSGGEEVANLHAVAVGAPACVLRAMRKVALDGWSLAYVLVPEAESDSDEPMRSSASSKQLERPQTSQSVAREMYVHLDQDGGSGWIHELLQSCGDNKAVLDAIELLHLLRTHGFALGLESTAWTSSKLDRKLRYQLEDPLTVVSGTLPVWAMILPRLCPFLFSLKTRKMLLKYTAFGPSFAVHWTQESKVGSFLRRRATVQTELNAQMDPRKIQELSQELSNIEEHVVRSHFWLGTLQSTLVRMQKGEDLLRQSDVAMELVARAGHLVEVQFDGETGFGSAVTQSFYVEVAQALQDRAVNRAVPMWVEDDGATDAQYLLCRKGLLVKPLVAGPLREAAAKRFRFLGRLLGQALREGFIVPLPLAEEVFSLLLHETPGASNLPQPGSGRAGELTGALADFAAELAAGIAGLVAEGRSEEEVRSWRAEQASRTDFAERFLRAHDQVGEGSPQQPMSFSEYVSLVGASFLETGLGGAPLCPEGENVAITVDNVEDFVQRAAAFWFGEGVQEQLDALRAGLDEVFPVECLGAFSRTELREMFCGEDRIDWDEQQLLNHLHPVGGLTEKSAVYKYLVAVLLELNQDERSRFLDFVSSCPRLPPGGMAKFHVDVFPDGTGTASKKGFPRSRACANQLYLPPYTSKEELKAKLHEAMHCSTGHYEQRVRDQ